MLLFREGISVSKLAKAILVVGIIWLVMVVGLGFAGVTMFGFRHMMDFMPNFIGVTESVQRIDTTVHEATDILNIEVVTRNGTVLVSNGAGSEVTVVARYIARANSKSAAEARLKGLSTKISEQEGTLHVEAQFSSQTITNESIAYEIQIPAGVDVAVRTSNGGITVLGLKGKLNLETSNGTIEITSDVGPEEITARTSNGRIILHAVPNGGVYNLRTSNGAINITLPEESGVKVDLGTSNGNINLGPGQWLLEGGQISSRSAQATRGDGSLSLRAITSNGHITITKP